VIRASHPDIEWHRLPDLQITTGWSAHGGPWALVAEVPQGAFNWDVFYYAPSETYPATIHGGMVERIGRWAYVHD
jgi:hypothetical protein